VGGYELLRHPDRVGRVSHHEQFQLFVEENVAGSYHSLDHRCRLLHVGVVQVEALR
jgi:hypothetical protein